MRTLPAQDPLSGDWKFAPGAEGGERRADTTLRVGQAAVTGRWRRTAVTGESAEGMLDRAFRFTSDEGGFTDTLRIEGILENETLTGMWAFAQYAGAFVAKRRE
jgi:hypothetical protein